MIKRTYLRGLQWLIVILAPITCLGQYSDKDIQNYIEKYKELAIQKMVEFKIPASITLAQGIFESACGTSRLAVDGNNHFGIKCHNDWEGDTLKIDDDELQECFRKYEKAEDSYTDHSLFLTTRKRYASLFTLDVMDYKAWARGLKAAGYATNPQYADRIINLIEKYNIAHQDTICQQRMKAGQDSKPQEIAKVEFESKGNSPVATYTPKTGSANTPSKEENKKTNKPTTSKTPTTSRVSPTKPNTPQTTIATNKVEPKPASQKPVLTYTPRNIPTTHETTETKAETTSSSSAIVFTATKKDFPKEEYPFTDRQVYINNKTLFIIAQPGDTYAKIAEDVQTTEKNVRRYNDMGKNGEPRDGEVIYIEHKSKRGATKEHIVNKGETLRYISQKYAIPLEMIYHYNTLNEKSIIHPNDHIKLQ